MVGNLPQLKAFLTVSLENLPVLTSNLEGCS
jgi:hypothetical protein